VVTATVRLSAGKTVRRLLTVINRYLDLRQREKLDARSNEFFDNEQPCHLRVLLKTDPA
jgi:hypothetical protein